MLELGSLEYTFSSWRLECAKNFYEKARISEECLFLDLCQDHENTNNENDLADKQGFNLGISS